MKAICFSYDKLRVDQKAKIREKQKIGFFAKKKNVWEEIQTMTHKSYMQMTENNNNTEKQQHIIIELELTRYKMMMK